MTTFRRMLNLFGAYIAFGPLVYFTISLFTASVYKSVIAFSIVFYIAHTLQQKIYHKKVRIAGKAALITGCDSGFGNMAAHQLAGLGMVVFAGCLDAEKAKPCLEFNSETTPGGKIIPVQMDVTKDDQVKTAREFVVKTLKENNLKFWAVVNNAGVAVNSEAEMASMEAVYKLFEVNFFGVVRVTNAFIPLLRYAKGSRVVNIASVLGFIGFPGTSVYSASKSAVLQWSESLRFEMLKFDIQVCTICPDFYNTPMTHVENYLNSFDAQRKRLPRQVREAYGEEYLDNFRRYLSQMNSVVQLSHDTSPVINAICDSVLGYRPTPVNLPIKIPARLAKAALSFPLMPQILVDWLMMTLGEQDKVPVAWNSQFEQREAKEGEEYPMYILDNMDD